MVMTYIQILKETGLQLNKPREAYYTSRSAGAPYVAYQNAENDLFLDDISPSLQALAAYMSTVSFFNSLVNNPKAYADCAGNPAKILETQARFAGEWKLMLDQLKNVIPDVFCHGGIVAVPNLDWIRKTAEPSMKNPTEMRRDFSAVMQACITVNYKEAQNINRKLRLNIKCFDEYVEVTERVISEQEAIVKYGGEKGE